MLFFIKIFNVCLYFFLHFLYHLPLLINESCLTFGFFISIFFRRQQMFVHILKWLLRIVALVLFQGHVKVYFRNWLFHVFWHCVLILCWQTLWKTLNRVDALLQIQVAPNVIIWEQIWLESARYRLHIIRIQIFSSTQKFAFDRTHGRCKLCLLHLLQYVIPLLSAFLAQNVSLGQMYLFFIVDFEIVLPKLLCY